MRKQSVGSFRHEFTITHETQSSTALDSRGQSVPTTATFATVRGSLRTLRMDEPVLANQQYARATHEIHHQFLAGVTEQMKYSENGRTFNILGIEDVDERQRKQRAIVREDKST